VVLLGLTARNKEEQGNRGDGEGEGSCAQYDGEDRRNRVCGEEK
jgi:hypothetical protein